MARKNNVGTFIQVLKTARDWFTFPNKKEYKKFVNEYLR